MKPFEVLAEQEEYRDGKRFSVIRARLKTPSGDIVNWAYQQSGDGVVVIALDEDHNMYITQEWRLNVKDFVWELPCGWIEIENPTEKDILDAANRELQEEVGIIAGNLVLLKSLYLMNYSTSKFHVVLARDLKRSSLPGDKHEYITSEKLPFEEAKDRLLKHQMPFAPVFVACKLAEEYLEKKK